MKLFELPCYHHSKVFGIGRDGLPFFRATIPYSKDFSRVYSLIVMLREIHRNHVAGVITASSRKSLHNHVQY